MNIIRIKRAHIIVFGIFLVSLDFSCGERISLPGAANSIEVDSTLTDGAISMIENYSKLFSKKYICQDAGNGNLFYSVDSTMPANQYFSFENSAYSGKKVSFVNMFSALYNLDDFRTIWDCANIGFTYYGACVPKNLEWPYPCSNGYRNDIFLSKLIPVSSFQSLKLDSVWSNQNTPQGVPILSIMKIKSFFLEPRNGFINTHYPLLYSNKSSCLGIIFNVELNNGRILPCYLINNDLNCPITSTNPSTILWKK
jgi:hypothetical protein